MIQKARCPKHECHCAREVRSLTKTDDNEGNLLEVEGKGKTHLYLARAARLSPLFDHSQRNKMGETQMKNINFVNKNQILVI